MRRITSLCTITVLLFCLFTLQTFAHPGSLDENGGHYDHSTGEYHYHEGINQDNNPSGDSYNYYYDNHKSDNISDTVSKMEKLTFFNSPLAAPFWFSVSWILLPVFSYIDSNYRKRYKNLWLFFVVMAIISTLAIFSMLLSTFFFGSYSELSTAIIFGIAASVLFNFKADLSKTKLVIFLLLTFLLGIFTHLLLQKQFISELMVMYTMFAVIGYILLDKFLKREHKGLIKYKSAPDSHTIEQAETTVSKEKEDIPPIVQENFLHIDKATPQIQEQDQLLEKMFIEQWNQRQSAKSFVQRNLQSAVSTSQLVEDEEQRIASLLEYVDEVEAFHKQYKKNK